MQERAPLQRYPPRRIAHTPFKYPGSGGGSLCARWGGTHQHPAIPNFTQRSIVVLSIFKRAILKPVFKPPRRKHTWVSSFNGSRNCPARIIELFPRIHNFEFQNFQVEFFRDTSNHQPTLAAPCPPLIPCTTSPPPSDRRWMMGWTTSLCSTSSSSHATIHRPCRWRSTMEHQPHQQQATTLLPIGMDHTWLDSGVPSQSQSQSRLFRKPHQMLQKPASPSQSNQHWMPLMSSADEHPIKSTSNASHFLHPAYCHQNLSWT